MFVINVNTYRDAQTESSQTGAFAHELKHAYQFDNGKLSFKADPNNSITKTPGYLYDITDEVEAHQRGRIFGAGSVVPDSNIYPDLSKSERHIGIDNRLQFINYEKKNGTNLLKNNIFINNK